MNTLLFQIYISQQNLLMIHHLTLGKVLLRSIVYFTILILNIVTNLLILITPPTLLAHYLKYLGF